MRRRVAVVVLGVWATMGVLPASAREQSREAATMVLPTVSPFFIVQSVAVDRGLFAENAVELKTVVVQGIGGINAVIAGSAEFALGTAGTLLRGTARGQRLNAIATLADRLSLQLIMRRSTAAAASFDPKASLAVRAGLMRNHVIARESFGGRSYAFLRIHALQAGIEPESVRGAPMMQTSMEAALDAGEIDGFIAGPAYSTAVVLSGKGVAVANGPDGDPPDMVPIGFAIIMTQPSVCEQRPQLCLAVGHALKEAAAYVADHHEAAIAAMRKRFPALSEVVIAASMEVALRAIPRSPVITAAQFEHADLYNIAAGFTKPADKRASYDNLFTNEYVR